MSEHEWLPAIKPDLSQRVSCYVCNGERFITIPPTDSKYLCATCSGRGWFYVTELEIDPDDDD